MSIVRTVPGLGWIINHETYLEDVYRESKLRSAGLFDVRTPYRMDAEAEKIAAIAEGQPPTKRRKKAKPKDEKSGFDLDTKLCKEFLNSLEGDFASPPSSAVIRENNRAVRQLANRLQASDRNHQQVSGGGRSSGSRRLKLDSDNVSPEYIIPRGSEFFVAEAGKCLGEMVNANRTFDVIVLDPPWENRHVKRERTRKRGYRMLSNQDILASLPIGQLLNEDGLLFLWCVTSRRHCAAAEEWIRAWNLRPVVKWIWLKTTASGEPVVDLDKEHGKHPFEFVFVARRKGGRYEPSETKVICSVPSAIQSHKPPLDKVAEEAFGIDTTQLKCLEVFGRYLLPGWTTVGNQCLKFQASHYFIPAE